MDVSPHDGGEMIDGGMTDISPCVLNTFGRNEVGISLMGDMV